MPNYEIVDWIYRKAQQDPKFEAFNSVQSLKGFIADIDRKATARAWMDSDRDDWLDRINLGNDSTHTSLGSRIKTRNKEFKQILLDSIKEAKTLDDLREAEKEIEDTYESDVIKEITDKIADKRKLLSGEAKKELTEDLEIRDIIRDIESAATPDDLPTKTKIRREYGSKASKVIEAIDEKTESFGYASEKAKARIEKITDLNTLKNFDFGLGETDESRSVYNQKLKELQQKEQQQIEKKSINKKRGGK